MGLFDFLDLQGNTGAWDAAGAAAQGVQGGMEKGANMAAQDYGVLAKFDELGLKRKAAGEKEKDPYNLGLLKDVQEINTMPIVPNAEDERIAAIEILGSEEAINSGKEVSLDDLNAIEQRKMQIANASLPDLTLDNPLPWLQARLARTGLRSDAEEKELAAIRSEKRDHRRMDHADKKQATQISATAAENRKAQEEMAARLGLTLKVKKDIHGANLGQRQKEKAVATAEARAKELQRYIDNTGKNSIMQDQTRAREFLTKLAAIGQADRETYNTALITHGEILKSKNVVQQINSARAVKDNKTPIKGRSYIPKGNKGPKEGDMRLDKIDGRNVKSTFKGGKWVRGS